MQLLETVCCHEERNRILQGLGKQSGQGEHGNNPLSSSAAYAARWKWLLILFLAWSPKWYGTTYLNLSFETVDKCSDCRFLLPESEFLLPESEFLNFLRRGIGCLVGGRKKWIGDTDGTIQLPKRRHVFPFEMAWHSTWPPAAAAAQREVQCSSPIDLL